MTSHLLDHLAPAHRALLEASAISPEVAGERGYLSLDAEAAASELPALGFKEYQAAVGSGLLVPSFDVSGANGSYQYRANNPRLRDGKPIKYDTPTGAHNSLDLHPRSVRYAGDPNVPLIITEGVKKADSMVSLNIQACVVALTGVWNWRGKNPSGGKVALAQFNELALNERTVILLFDSDARTNSSLQKALSGLRAFLRSKGANVTVVLPPPSPDSGKVGVDDYLAAGGDWNELFTHTFDPDVERTMSRGRLASEMRSETLTEPPWLMPGMFAAGWATKLAAREKTGKGKLLAYCIGKMERAEDSVFGPANPEPIYSLVLTEEPDESMVEKLNDHDVQHARIICGWELSGYTWEQKWNHLVNIAVEDGRRLIGVDNIARAAGVADDADLELANAVTPFADACREANLGLAIDHHHKKTGDSIENMSRGGTALPGAMDINIEMIRTKGGGWLNRKRHLYARGRNRSSTWEKVIELAPDDMEYTVAKAAPEYDPADTFEDDPLKMAGELFGLSDMEHGHRKMTTWRALRDHGPFTVKAYKEFADLETDRTARKHLDELKESGLVQVEQEEAVTSTGGKTRANVYRCVTPEATTAPAPAPEEPEEAPEDDD